MVEALRTQSLEWRRMSGTGHQTTGNCLFSISFRPKKRKGYTMLGLRGHQWILGKGDAWPPHDLIIVRLGHGSNPSILLHLEFYTLQWYIVSVSALNIKQHRIVELWLCWLLFYHAYVFLVMTPIYDTNAIYACVEIFCSRMGQW